MSSIRKHDRVCIDAPAKLNLFLELHGRREDGFHELETLMVPINIYDSLSVTARDDVNINLTCNWAPGSSSTSELPPASKNIAYKAVTLLREHADIDAGADIHLVKRIPAMAGMGGGSSDAAAALVAANRAWGLNCSRQELSEIAARVGSDVPFFLFNGLSRCTGRGEIIEPLPMNGRLDFVVVMPDFGLSTPDVFRAASVPAEPQNSESLTAALTGQNPPTIAQLMFNRLEQAAASLTPWLKSIARRMDELVVCGHQMSGSGTSYFALCRNKRHAMHVAAKLRATRLGQVFAANTIGPHPAR